MPSAIGVCIARFAGAVTLAEQIQHREIIISVRMDLESQSVAKRKDSGTSRFVVKYKPAVTVAIRKTMKRIFNSIHLIIRLQIKATCRDGAVLKVPGRWPKLDKQK